MSIFSAKKKKEEKAPAKATTSVGVSGGRETKENAAVLRNPSVLVNPRITEKATLKGEIANAYTFDISPKATKKEVEKSVKKIYNVTPVKVNIARVPDKVVSYRGRIGRKSGGKKAFVYLKKGDKIEFV